MLESGSVLPTIRPLAHLGARLPHPPAATPGSVLASLTFMVLECKPSLYLILFS